jgi:hypothetical protein
VAESVVGWRFGQLTRPAVNRAERRKAPGGLVLPDFSNRGVSKRATCNPRLFAGFGLSWSPYTEQAHDAPDPRCQCGYRVVEDLDELQDYFDLGERKSPGALGGAMVLYRVEGFGRVLPGPAPMSDDPPSTSRASSLRLLGPIYLRDDRTGRAADRHLDRFRPRPEVWYVDDPRDLWTADLEHHLTDA